MEPLYHFKFERPSPPPSRVLANLELKDRALGRLDSKHIFQFKHILPYWYCFFRSFWPKLLACLTVIVTSHLNNSDSPKSCFIFFFTLPTRRLTHDRGVRYLRIRNFPLIRPRTTVHVLDCTLDLS